MDSKCLRVVQIICGVSYTILCYGQMEIKNIIV